VNRVFAVSTIELRKRIRVYADMALKDSICFDLCGHVG